MTISREVKESPMTQGVDEQIAYKLTTTPWGSSPSAPSCVVYDITDGTRTDVTATVMPTNAPVALADEITLSLLKSLTANHLYRVEIKFTCSGNVFEAYANINAEN